MARRRKGYTTGREIRDLQKRSIRIPQPSDRPIHLHGRDAVRRELVKPNAWWFVEHRRGIHRPKVGEDPLEARAVSKQRVRGTLPERIVYRWLTSRLRMSEGREFTFQTSLQGGRMELGGMVADFLFPDLKIVINPAGPTHSEFLRERKDEEQINALAEMGYTTYVLPQDEIYNEPVFEDRMRRIFNIRPGYNIFSGESSNPADYAPEILADIYDTLLRIETTLLGYKQDWGG